MIVRGGPGEATIVEACGRAAANGARSLIVGETAMVFGVGSLRLSPVDPEPFAGAESAPPAKRNAAATKQRILDAGEREFTLLIESRGHVRTVTIHYRPTTLAAKR